MIELPCGMCDEMVKVPEKQMLEATKIGLLCDPCQSYTIGYIYPNAEVEGR